MVVPVDKSGTDGMTLSSALARLIGANAVMSRRAAVQIRDGMAFVLMLEGGSGIFALARSLRQRKAVR
jgi:hypothetical protein